MSLIARRFVHSRTQWSITVRGHSCVYRMGGMGEGGPEGVSWDPHTLLIRLVGFSLFVWHQHSCIDRIACYYSTSFSVLPWVEGTGRERERGRERRGRGGRERRIGKRMEKGRERDEEEEGEGERNWGGRGEGRGGKERERAWVGRE